MKTPSKKHKLLIGIGISLVTLGLLLGVYLYLDYRAGRPVKPVTLGVKLISLQNDSAILPEYKTYAYKMQEAWIREAGFDLHKRLYPQNDTGGVVRFKPPTEYFEVGLSTDSEKGITNINIVAASVHASGVKDGISDAALQELFDKGSREGSYDEVRTLPDGRIKADVAANGCIVDVSGFEKEKVEKLLNKLLDNCQDLL